MAYNFKSIADVEVVAEPTESANVLIEEDGIIKKAPKTAVGGGNGPLVLTFNDQVWVDEYEGYEIISAPDNLYEIIKEAYNNMTYVDVVGCNISNLENGWIYFLHLSHIFKEDDRYTIEIGYYGAHCYPNGRISVFYND